MPNRYICSVLDEMRECLKTNNFSYLLGLIEETQSLANRMESSLYDKNDFTRIQKEVKTLEEKKKKIEKEIEKLEAVKSGLSKATKKDIKKRYKEQQAEKEEVE